MEYEIIITKREPNPEYSPKQTMYTPERPEYLTTASLQTVLTEAEFKKIRDAIMKEF